MSDIFKIMYAQVLDVNSVESYNVETNVEQFMSGYFMIGDKYSSLKEKYPQTVSLLVANQ